jgi:hypothetical protein
MFVTIVVVAVFVVAIVVPDNDRWTALTVPGVVVVAPPLTLAFELLLHAASDATSPTDTANNRRTTTSPNPTFFV